GGIAAVAAAKTRMMHDDVGPPRTRGAASPMPMLSWRNMPAVGVAINGRGPYTFGSATRAPGHWMINAPVAAAAGLPMVGSAGGGDPSGRNPMKIAQFGVRELQLGGLTVLAPHAEELPAMGEPGGQLQGLLGMNLFDAYTLVLDFARREVSLSTSRLSPA